MKKEEKLDNFGVKYCTDDVIATEMVYLLKDRTHEETIVSLVNKKPWDNNIIAILENNSTIFENN